MAKSEKPTPEQIRNASECLERGGYHVISPLELRETFCSASPPEKLITVAILDTETTGLDQNKDQLIELGIVLVEIDPETGQAYRVLSVFNELEDPGILIPEESTRIHNITNEMVSGKRIDDSEVESLLSNVSLIVAHNAGFDRPFVERRFPDFQDKHWACSWSEIPWSDEGIGSGKLEFLAYRCGFHFTGHRASNDCFALLEILQTPLPVSGVIAMHLLLQNARTPDIKVSALGSPFESKDLLKERGYRWQPDKKIWATTISKKHLEEEVSWLKQYVYGGKSFKLGQEIMTAKNRYSSRTENAEIVKYD